MFLILIEMEWCAPGFKICCRASYTRYMPLSQNIDITYGDFVAHAALKVINMETLKLYTDASCEEVLRRHNFSKAPKYRAKSKKQKKQLSLKITKSLKMLIFCTSIFLVILNNLRMEGN